MKEENKVKLVENELVKAYIEWHFQMWQDLKPEPPIREMINVCAVHKKMTPEQQTKRITEPKTLAAIEAQMRYSERSQDQP